MGKYSHLVGVLPKLPLEDEEDPRYQEKVNGRKRLIIEGPEDPEKTLANVVFNEWTQDKRLEELKTRMRRIVDDSMVVNLILTSLAKKRQDPHTLAHAYREVRFVKDALTVEEKDLNLTVKAYEQLLGDSYETEALSSMRLADLGSGAHLVLSSPEPGIKVRNKEEFRQWCIDQGLQTEMHLHPSTAASMIKELCLKGQAAPPGTEVGMRNKVTMRKA